MPMPSVYSTQDIFEHWRFWEGSTHARFVAEAETALTRTALPSRGWEGALFDALLETADMAARQLQSRRW